MVEYMRAAILFPVTLTKSSLTNLQNRIEIVESVQPDGVYVVIAKLLICSSRNSSKNIFVLSSWKSSMNLWGLIC